MQESSNQGFKTEKPKNWANSNEEEGRVKWRGWWRRRYRWKGRWRWIAMLRQRGVERKWQKWIRKEGGGEARGSWKTIKRGGEEGNLLNALIMVLLPEDVRNKQSPWSAEMPAIDLSRYWPALWRQSGETDTSSFHCAARVVQEDASLLPSLTPTLCWQSKFVHRHLAPQPGFSSCQI